MMGFKYITDHLAFLEAGFPLLSCADLTERFNTHFGCALSVGQIDATLNRYKITSGRGAGRIKGYSLLFSPEQVDFIKANYSRWRIVELTEVVNKKFGLQIKQGQVKSFVKNHGIVSGRTGQFEKGQMPWNDGTKGTGICKPNSGCFNNGHVPANVKPVGHERVCSKDGYIIIKTAETNPNTGFFGWYRAKHVVNWEAHNGPVPEGKILRFKDGDPKNWAIENMELITRAEHARLNQLRLNQQPEDLRETVRVLAKLIDRTGRISRDLRP
jgi:hypothetical protein